MSSKKYQSFSSQQILIGIGFAALLVMVLIMLVAQLDGSTMFY